ncbi:MAG: V-type ATP synthase subunit E [Candidatus Hydrothermales bacterium]
MTVKEFVKEKIKKVIEEIEKEKNQEIKKIRDNFEKEKLKISESIIRETQEFLRIERVKRIAEVRMKVLNEFLNSRDKIYERLIEFFREEIVKKRKEGNYKKEIENIFFESLVNFGEEEGRVFCSPYDYEFIREIIKEKKLNFEVKVDEGIFFGVILERMDGKIRVLNTLESRLKKAEPYLMQILFKEIFKFHYG